jgi:hypothetical protein
MQSIKTEWTQLCGSPVKLSPKRFISLSPSFAYLSCLAVICPQTTVRFQDSQIFRTKHIKYAKLKIRNCSICYRRPKKEKKKYYEICKYKR